MPLSLVYDALSPDVALISTGINKSGGLKANHPQYVDLWSGRDVGQYFQCPLYLGRASHYRYGQVSGAVTGSTQGYHDAMVA
jgi:hypothetical protein